MISIALMTVCTGYFGGSIINDFDECLPHVVIPSYARVIGSCAFMDETVLQSIKMPSGLETIGSQAFFGCINLSDVTIPDTVTNIEEQAFMDIKRCPEGTFLFASRSQT